jgi:hypothetical protein
MATDNKQALVTFEQLQADLAALSAELDLAPLV